MNPEALNYYITRSLAKKKQDEEWKHRIDKRPGSGAVYINKLTVPKAIKLCTSKFDLENNKIIQMEDFLPQRHKRSNSEYFNSKKRLINSNLNTNSDACADVRFF